METNRDVCHAHLQKVAGSACGCKGMVDRYEKLDMTTEAHVHFRENLNLLPINYYDMYICSVYLNY